MAETEIILPAFGILMPKTDLSFSVDVKQRLVTRSAPYENVST
jgi:hypothetical protein